ncbi:hypothetical protein [Streptomyces sp. NEAU-S77]|uniref:hypothetical protein n=1 Tax=Streptomyces sp. NEAU-S77 TaxID=3411033 RepID=UPI003BA23F88
MIHLSFFPPELDSPWRRTWDAVKQGDPVAISEIDLRYKCFGVNAEMVVNGVEVISKSGFVTLVDLALSLSHVRQRISSGEDAAFGFTESEEVIHLRRDGGLISLSSSAQPWQVSVEPGELADAISGFLREAHSRLVADVPDLVANPVIRRLLMK